LFFYNNPYASALLLQKKINKSTFICQKKHTFAIEYPLP
jgi:hypothetical protein